MNLAVNIFVSLFKYIKRLIHFPKFYYYRKKYNIHATVKLGYNVTLSGNNIQIGEGTYINSGRIMSGVKSHVIIGKWCALSYNVSIWACSHDTINSTGPVESRPIIEKDIVIGDFVWVGTNAFIKEGVVIGNNVIIGANSVVTKDVPDNAIVGGVPAKIIKYKTIE